MTRVVADLGNTRLKWGRLGGAGELVEGVALPTDDPAAWAATLDAWGTEGVGFGISTVNPPAAERLRAFLAGRGIGDVRWFRSAAEVPVRHELEHAETAGADRALAVLGATGLADLNRPGFVVSCGTAITVERVGVGGLWHGGAILPGLGLAARSLHDRTAQLPRVEIGVEPPAWGRSTVPAIEAGVYWGTVGAIEGVLRRQARGLPGGQTWVIWTGGDASVLAPGVEWPSPSTLDRPPRPDPLPGGAGVLVVPDLVLMGLARVLARGDAP